MYIPNKRRTRFSHVEDSVIEVKQNMAVTPAQIAELTSNGMAVSSQNNLQFEEGVANPAHYPIEQTRGIDVADVWTAEQTSKAKMHTFVKSQDFSSSTTIN